MKRLLKEKSRLVSTCLIMIIGLGILISTSYQTHVFERSSQYLASVEAKEEERAMNLKVKLNDIKSEYYQNSEVATNQLTSVSNLSVFIGKKHIKQDLALAIDDVYRTYEKESAAMIEQHKTYVAESQRNASFGIIGLTFVSMLSVIVGLYFWGRDPQKK